MVTERMPEGPPATPSVPDNAQAAARALRGTAAGDRALEPVGHPVALMERIVQPIRHRATIMVDYATALQAARRLEKGKG